MHSIIPLDPTPASSRSPQPAPLGQHGCKYSREHDIGSGSDLTIGELAETVAKVVGFDGEIVWDTSKPDGTPRKLMDSSRIFSLGWQPSVKLPEGIKLAYEDYLSRKSNNSVQPLL